MRRLDWASWRSGVCSAGATAGQRLSCLDHDFPGPDRICLSLVQANLCSRLLGKCLLEIACSVPGTPGSQGVVEIPRPGTRGRLERADQKDQKHRSIRDFGVLLLLPVFCQGTIFFELWGL